MNGNRDRLLQQVLDELHQMDSRIALSIGKTERLLEKSLGRIDHSLGKVKKKLHQERRARMQVESDLRHAKRMLMAISNFHEALSSHSSEKQYLNHVCDSLVRSGEYPLAWIGLIEPGSDEVKPIASAGKGKSYLEGSTITYSEGPTGNGPTGRAIRFCSPQVSRCIEDDADFLPWKEKASRHNFSSSLALPLQYQEQVFGAINFYSEEVNAFTDVKIAMLQRVAGHVAFGIHSLRGTSLREEESERTIRQGESRNAIAALLETSLEPISLHRQLEKALDIILSISWLSIESKGSIFLADSKTRSLMMEVQKNLAIPLLTLCKRIPYGHCLCGKAAQSEKMVFTPHLTSDHDVTFPGIKPHGHYCIPIISNNNLLGVLNLYVPDGHASDPEEAGFFSTIANTLAGIIERKTIEEEITRLARFDNLTGLFNRHTFEEYMNHELARARRESLTLAVLFLDLDHFKEVNDQNGHGAGDELLRQASHRINGLMRETDIIGRFGGDEFCILLTTLNKPDDAVRVGQKIVEELNNPFDICGVSCSIGVSIGISIYPEHGMEARDLLKHADQALYEVKKTGKNNVLLFSEEMNGKTAVQEGG